MFIEIISPETSIYSGEIKRAKFPGIDGSFEVLNHHAAIISILKKGKIEITDNSNKALTFDVNGGVVELQKNKIIVLAE